MESVQNTVQKLCFAGIRTGEHAASHIFIAPEYESMFQRDANIFSCEQCNLQF